MLPQVDLRKASQSQQTDEPVTSQLLPNAVNHLFASQEQSIAFYQNEK